MVILARLVTVATCTPASLTQTSLSSSPVPPGHSRGGVLSCVWTEQWRPCPCWRCRCLQCRWWTSVPAHIHDTLLSVFVDRAVVCPSQSGPTQAGSHRSVIGCGVMRWSTRGIQDCCWQDRTRVLWSFFFFLDNTLFKEHTLTIKNISKCISQ